MRVELWNGPYRDERGRFRRRRRRPNPYFEALMKACDDRADQCVLEAVSRTAWCDARADFEALTKAHVKGAP